MDDLSRPLYAQTQAVLSALDGGNATALQPMVTEDVSLVDADDAGRATALHTPEALAEHLARRGPTQGPSTIIAYQGHRDRETGWSVARIRRSSRGPGGETHRELCSATLLWRLTADGWKLNRWHCTVERREDPAS